MTRRIEPKDLRSRAWFDNPHNPDMTALYLERYLNFGLTRQELQSGKPIIGIAQTGSDLSPCNRPISNWPSACAKASAAGGVAIEFPVHPIQETGKRPTASLDRNLAYLGLVEVLYGYPLDGVVLTTGCDKTTPACLMAAATVNIPAIALSGGPMLNGWFKGERTARAPSSGRRASCSPKARSTTSNSSSSSPPRRPRPATATPWARPRR
jgi:dihydroxy-acid dehydratase